MQARARFSSFWPPKKRLDFGFPRGVTRGVIGGVILRKTCVDKCIDICVDICVVQGVLRRYPGGSLGGVGRLLNPF